MYPLCFVGDITLIYQELKAVHLRTINRGRAELLLSQYLTDGKVRPPPLPAGLANEDTPVLHASATAPVARAAGAHAG